MCTSVKCWVALVQLNCAHFSAYSYLGEIEDSRVCVFVHIRKYKCTGVCMSIHRYVHTYVCHVCTHTGVRTYVCMHLYTFCACVDSVVTITREHQLHLLRLQTLFGVCGSSIIQACLYGCVLVCVCVCVCVHICIYVTCELY